MSARSATALRLEIEHALERSFPAALSPASRSFHETASTGVETIDALLEGGLPVGAISELTGPASSGRTSLTLAFLAQRTSAGQVCAWVDTNDAFDPESAAASGVNLRQLLWIRLGRRKAVQASNRKAEKPWTRLDQALRATDLLLQAGGFAAIVLDLGDTAAEYALRIPLATWFRFRQAADRARSSLVVLAQASCAQSSAAAVLECSPMRRPVTSGGPVMACNSATADSLNKDSSTVLRGFDFEMRHERQRAMPFTPAKRKSPASTWTASGSWDVEQSA